MMPPLDRSPQAGRTPGVNMRRQYVLALSLLAVLSAAAYASLEWVIRSNETYSSAINIGGRQRMLPQRIGKIYVPGGPGLHVHAAEHAFPDPPPSAELSRRPSVHLTKLGPVGGGVAPNYKAATLGGS